MPKGGYKAITVKAEVYEELEKMRRELGLMSVPEVVEYLVRFYRSGSMATQATSASPAPASPATNDTGELTVKFSDVMRLINAIVEYEKAKERTREYLRSLG